MTFRSILFCIVFLLAALNHSQAEVPLPTPKDHYKSFDPALAGLNLFTEMMGEAPPEVQKMMMDLANAPVSESLAKIPKAEVRLLLSAVDWKKWKAPVLEVFLHYSNVLDVIPENPEKWTPVVHDGLLYFLDHLDQERLLDRFLDLVYLPPDSPRGERILQFASRTPTFQKIGQILGRNTGVEGDIQKSLQSLENTIQTASYQELVKSVNDSLGREVMKTYDIKLADRILAEASVGAVIRATVQMPERRSAVMWCAKSLNLMCSGQSRRKEKSSIS